ncbi:MAG: DUF1592 domain-containing protein [Myxococcales bacterium]|nr:MAG: DUF1592 domain-containing protein [Myxococcales bacterium]
MQNRRLLGTAGVLLAIGLGGCVGKIGSSGPEAGPLGPGGPDSPGTAGSSSGPGGPGSASGDCTAPQVGAERIQRLTPREYTNSLRALLDDDALAPVLDADKEPIATLDAVRKWFNAAEAAVPSDAAWLGRYGRCDPATDVACAKELYESFAERAFRRPLKEDEREWLASSWAALPARATNVQRLEVMGELVLQAPQFLYQYAEGTPAGAVNVLDGHARAERLSYFLWDAPPDADLLAAAASGELDTREGMRAHGERLLADERAKPVLRSFLADWLELEGATILPGLDETPKDSKLFPGFDGALRQSMRRELETFMDHVMFEADGSLMELFTSTRAYVNGPLAELYGVEGPATADEWAWVDLEPTERAGMLTRAGFLAVHASQNVTSPIRRGVYLLKEVLCATLPSPPANVDNTPVEVTGGEIKTVRQATLQRTGNAACGGCHSRINELGFAFEHYDAIGRWQEEEAQTGEAVDATANLDASGSSLRGTVDGAIELSRLLAESPEVATCATERWFQVALKRSPAPLDACSIQEIRAKTSETRSIRELLLALATSDAFSNVSHRE